jgi:hypothetical protein
VESTDSCCSCRVLDEFSVRVIQAILLDATPLLR